MHKSQERCLASAGVFNSAPAFPYYRRVKPSSLSPLIALLAGASLAGSAVAQSTPSAPAAHSHTAKTAAATTALPKNIPPAHGLMRTAYSLKYIDTKVGTGDLATPNKFYTVRYTGWLATDGKKFDSSEDHGGTATFPVGAHRIIPGWDTGFTGMHIGGKRRLFIPWQLAYGELGHPPVIPGKADLIFDVELISISDRPPAPPTPPARPAAPSTPPPAAPSAPAAPATPPAAAPATPPAPAQPATPPQ